MSKKNPIQLSDHFTYARLFRFVLPSIVMMVFTSIYGVVDGLFVSNFAGKTAFASINLIMPFLIILGAMGFMLGTGGTALVSRVLGEGDTYNRPSGLRQCPAYRLPPAPPARPACSSRREKSTRFLKPRACRIKLIG